MRVILVKKMKKLYFFSLVLVCIIAVSSVILSKALCEDDDPVFDTLGNGGDILHFNEFFSSVLSATGLFYEQRYYVVYPKPIILYLERQEKSPPYIPAVFPTV
jgi:hypothetical protein